MTVHQSIFGQFYHVTVQLPILDLVGFAARSERFKRSFLPSTNLWNSQIPEKSSPVAILVANVVFSNIHRYSESLLVLLLSHRSAVLEGKEIQTDLNQKLELPLK